MYRICGHVLFGDFRHLIDILHVIGLRDIVYLCFATFYISARQRLLVSGFS
jgi:hypothetical protein